MRRSFKLHLTRLSIVVLVLVTLPHPANSSGLGWFQDAWRRIMDSPPPVSVSRGGSRGGYFCSIAPNMSNSQTFAILGDRPTLVWKGAIAKVELIDSEQQVIWPRPSETVTLTPLPSTILSDPGRETYQVTAGITLEPGQSYRWRITKEPFREPFTIPFRVLSVQEQANLQLPGNSAPPIERATALAKTHLWSDFWRDILVLQPMPPEVATLADNSFAQLCPLINTDQMLSLTYPTSEQDFTGYANHLIEVEVTSDAFQPQVEVLSPEGKPLSKDKTSDEPSPEKKFRTRAIVRLTEQGSYRIRVTAPPGKTGEFQLTAALQRP
jgi:hypothetical protein